MDLRNLAPILPLFIFLTACPPTETEHRDDVEGDDDDSAADAPGDDDTSGSGGNADAPCAGAGAPFAFDFSGDFSGSYAFDEMACTPYGGDAWNLSLNNSSGWIFRVVMGPVVEGEVLESGIDITLQNNGKQAVFSGRTSLGHIAAVDVQIYEASSGPCGALTTDELGSANSEGSLAIAPQPILFDCR